MLANDAGFLSIHKWRLWIIVRSINSKSDCASWASCLLQYVSSEQDGLLLLSNAEFPKQKNCHVLRYVYKRQYLCSTCRVAFVRWFIWWWWWLIYRMSQELRSLLRESVPYVKIYRHNPKHLCPKLNGYGDNSKRKVWTSWGCTLYTCQLAVICVRPCVECHVTEFLLTVARSQELLVCSRQSGKPCYISVRNSNVMYSASNPKDNNDTSANVSVLHLMALCHSQVTLMLSTDINITETTYSCQFQYEFGNQ